MNLYCWQHNETHRFVPIDVERIVYTLIAAEADASTDTDSPLRGEDSYEHLRCMAGESWSFEWIGGASLTGGSTETADRQPTDPAQQPEATP